MNSYGKFCNLINNLHLESKPIDKQMIEKILINLNLI
jgi:hypothetical protein